MSDPGEVLERDGYRIVAGVLDDQTAVHLCAQLSSTPGDVDAGATPSRRGGAVYAMRNVLTAFPAVRELARSAAVRALVEPTLGPGCVAVRAILFDKVVGANWNLAWHQDLSVALCDRVETPGWGPWSVKAGAVHVHAPASVLERMLAVRLHLDPCGPENGPLRVLPGSHRFGQLDAEAVSRLRSAVPEVICTVERGDALVIRPLLLHASLAAAAPGHRRVLHIEFAAAGVLPHGMDWREAVAA